MRDDGALRGYPGEPLPKDHHRRGGGGDGIGADLYLLIVFQPYQNPPEHVLCGMALCLCVSAGGAAGAAVFLCDLQAGAPGKLQPPPGGNRPESQSDLPAGRLGAAGGIAGQGGVALLRR